jgi:Asp-tRNA(Asn)/Glu-tRNA(Gln) amidotransferase A subunit family amidase
LTVLKIAWSDEWAEVPMAAEIKTAMVAGAQKLVQAGAQLTSWLPPNFNLSDRHPDCWQTLARNGIVVDRPRD